MDINSLHNAARSGDKSAEDELFRVLSDNFRLFVQLRIGNTQDSQEIVQDTLLTISSKYRDIEFETSFAAWAYRVLENKLLVYYRSRKSEAGRFDHAAECSEQADPDNTDPAVKRRLLDCLRHMNKANKRHARILNLHYQGYTMDEICGRLKLTRNAAYILLSRARSALKACLEKGKVS